MATVNRCPGAARGWPGSAYLHLGAHGRTTGDGRQRRVGHEAQYPQRVDGVDVAVSVHVPPGVRREARHLRRLADLRAVVRVGQRRQLRERIGAEAGVKIRDREAVVIV